MQPILFYFKKKNINHTLKALLRFFKCLFPDKIYLKYLYRLTFNKTLNLDNPQTFSEKIQWLKLYNRKSEYTQLVDKAEVKQYVKKVIGEEYVIPTYYIWDKLDEIDINILPNKFVLKTTGGGGSTGVVICNDKNQLDYDVAKRKLKRSSENNIYINHREWPYKNVRPRFIAEQLLEMPDGSDLMDYKFFCFNGEPKYCQVISGRNDVMSIDFFDMEWVHQPFHEPRNFPFAEVCPSKPLNFDLMRDLSRKLAGNIPFVRIDFYNICGKIYFSEITFFPTSGLGGFSPEEWDLKLGQMINLNEV